MDLVEALAARGAVAGVVGAGGKKSTLYALADRLERAIVTATVRIPPFEAHVADLRVVDDPLSQFEGDEPPGWPLGLVRGQEQSDRYVGYDPEAVDDLATAVAADVSVLVKADGARTRWLKAPGENEPQLPATSDVVVPIASARVVGERLTDEHVHRPERVAAVTGRDLGERISASDVGAVLASDRGGFADVPDGATVIPTINMVDSPDLERTAREIALDVLDRRSVPRVVLTRLVDDDPVVDVVR